MSTTVAEDGGMSIGVVAGCTEDVSSACAYAEERARSTNPAPNIKCRRLKNPNSVANKRESLNQSPVD